MGRGKGNLLYGTRRRTTGPQSLSPLAARQIIRDIDNWQNAALALAPFLDKDDPQKDQVLDALLERVLESANVTSYVSPWRFAFEIFKDSPQTTFTPTPEMREMLTEYMQTNDLSLLQGEVILDDPQFHTLVGKTWADTVLAYNDHDQKHQVKRLVDKWLGYWSQMEDPLWAMHARHELSQKKPHLLYGALRNDLVGRDRGTTYDGINKQSAEGRMRDLMIETGLERGMDTQVFEIVTGGHSRSLHLLETSDKSYCGKDIKDGRLVRRGSWKASSSPRCPTCKKHESSVKEAGEPGEFPLWTDNQRKEINDSSENFIKTEFEKLDDSLQADREWVRKIDSRLWTRLHKSMADYSAQRLLAEGGTAKQLWARLLPQGATLPTKKPSAADLAKVCRVYLKGNKTSRQERFHQHTSELAKEYL